jgi:uncharacterized protein (DUF4415 family)
MTKPPTRYRPTDPREAAEQAFKAVTTKAAPPLPAAPLIKVPVAGAAREMVALKLDRDVLDFFQADGPGWQDRINAALKSAMEKHKE